MAEEKNFLEQINAKADKKKAAMEPKKVVEASVEVDVVGANGIESFQQENFISTKRQVNYGPFILGVCILIVLAIVYAVFIYNPVMSLNLVGLDLEQAGAWADDHNVLIMTKEVYSNDEAQGIILSQSIDEGEKLSGSTTMVLEVSSGRDPYETVVLPAFDGGWNRSSIIQWLSQNGVENFELVQVVDSKVPEDYLITFKVVGATVDTFNRSSAIEFVFSQVTESSTITMDNFLGNTLEQLDVWALEQNMTYTYERAYSDIYSDGTIMKQEQLPNTDVLTTEVLKFTLSLGSSDEMVAMPGFVNSSHDNADAWMKDNAMSYDYIYKYSRIYPDGTVMAQSVPPNTEVSKTDVITLSISMGEGVVVPNYSDYVYSMIQIPNDQFDGTVIAKTVYDLEVPEGQLISQSIKRGAYVGPDAILDVVYSLGASVSVPDFRGMINLEVEDWVNEAQNKGASIRVEFVEDETLSGNYGEVVYQSHYNEKVVLDQIVECVIATGNKMPNFREMTLEEAQSFAQTVSYPIEIQERYYRDTYVGDCIGQSVKAGTEVYEGTYLVVEYSLGASVLIPNHQGEPLINLETWRREQNELGAHITLKVSEEYDEDIVYGDIIAQSRYNEYSGMEQVVDVLVSKGEAYHLLNLTYQNRSMIEDMAQVNDLNIIFIEVESDEHYSGQVIGQEPEADTWISKKDFIYVTIVE